LFDPIDITLTDPREFDGNPYEVADRAIAQVEEAVRQLAQPLYVARLMARNADMERNIALRKPPAGSAYNDGPQGKAFDRIEDRLASAYKSLGALRAAASYDPRHPPKG
jgi:hypothetical protein